MTTTFCRVAFVLLVISIAVPGVLAASTAVGISAVAADTSGPPPNDVSVYISDTRTAVAGQNWSGAMLVTTRGLRWFPDNAELLCLQGYTYRKIGQYGNAVEQVSRAIRLNPLPVRYANRGYAYLAQGNYSAALADAEAGIALNATYPVTWGVKALALQGMGRSGEALAAIDQALALAPDSAHYWHVKGQILAATGDCTGATAALEKSRQLDDSYVLPWPGFGSAEENLADLNATCAPAATSGPRATAKAPLGWGIVIGVAGAAIAAGTRKSLP